MTGMGLLVTMLVASSYAELLCAFSDEEQAEFESVVVEGIYRRGFEISTFLPLDSKNPWWAVSPKLEELLKSANAPYLRVVVRGLISPVGKYGNGLEYERCLIQVEVLKVVESEGADCEEEGEVGRALPD